MQVILDLKTRLARGRWFRFGLLPCAFYLLGFVLLTYPLVATFGGRLWSSDADGWQNLWNLWWVHKALFELGQLPWHTTWLHHAYGISLWSHALSPLQGLLASALVPTLPFHQIYNLLLLFSMVASGLTAFYLAYFLTKSYAPSLMAGYLYTFSSNHLAHATAHLNWAAAEWVPLFFLCWYAIWSKPGVKFGVLGAFALGAAALSDYYYFLYCVIAAAVMSAWFVVRRRGVPREQARALGAFLLVSLLTVLPFVAPLLVELAQNPIRGHPPELYSLDLLQLFVPGSNSRFAEFTLALSSRWAAGGAEGNAALGVAVSLTLAVTFWQRKKLREANVLLWYLLLLVFALLSLGPVLHWNGDSFASVPMPYEILTGIFPVIKASGIPIRMVVMISLCAAVLCAYGLKLFLGGTKPARFLGIALVCVMLVETLPGEFHTSALTVPPYVSALAVLPGSEGVLDVVETGLERLPEGGTAANAHALYHQMIYDKPIAFGYVARVPPETRRLAKELWQVVQAMQTDVLCVKYDLRYVAIAPGDIRRTNALEKNAVVYQDGTAIVYDLKPDGQCVPQTSR